MMVTLHYYNDIHRIDLGTLITAVCMCTLTLTDYTSISNTYMNTNQVIGFPACLTSIRKDAVD